MREDIKFRLNNIEEDKVIVDIKFPFIMGWIEDVNITFFYNGNKLDFPIDHIQNKGDYAYFQKVIKLEKKASYNYLFSYKVNGNRYYFTKDGINMNMDISNTWKLNFEFKVPDWAKGKVMYHIFIDRFNRGENTLLREMPRRHIYDSFLDKLKVGADNEGIWNNDYYGGNINGIIEKLDYIKSLGVDIIYLSPICQSQSNHRYDTADFENVDPYIGTNDDLKRLCDISHKKGIKIVLDAVFNHTGNDSKYFNEYHTYDEIGAYESPDSKYSGFYKKNSDGNFEYWWGMRNLPVCDGNSKEWKDYILSENGIIDKWFNLGIDGLRLDVADELSDDFIYGIRTAVKRNKEDGLIIGEVWKNPMRMNREYLSSGKGMDSVMNYFFIDAMIRYFKYGDSLKLKETIKEILNEYPEESIYALMNFTSTHDISRAINIFSANDFNEYAEWAWDLNKNDLEWCKNFKLLLEDYRKGKKLYKAYLFALIFMPGIFSIFYGDEIGIEGMGNLYNRKSFNLEDADLDLIEYFRFLGKIRKEEKYLETAKLNIIDINDNYIMFERILKDKKSLIVVNRTAIIQKINLPKNYVEGRILYSLNKSNSKVLKPYGGINIKEKL